MRPIIKWTLRQNRYSTFFWSLGTVIYILLVTSVYKSFVNSQVINLGKNIEKLPDAIKSFASITNDFHTPAGFLSSEPYYVVLPMIFLIIAIRLGSSLLSREEADGTIELLLSRPVSRARLLAAKALAGIIILLLINIVAALAMIICTHIFKMEISSVLILKAHLMLLLLSMLFGALAFMLTAIGRLGRSASLGITMLLAIGGYVLTSLEKAVHWLYWPARVLPYHYYEPSKILNNNFTAKAALGYLICIVIFGFVAWLAFRRRDLTS